MTVRMRLKQISLLLLAMAISAIGFFQMFRRTTGDASTTFLVLLLVVGALFVLLWALIARYQPYASQAILPCVLLLSAIGTMMIARIDNANTALGKPSDVATRQLVWLATALVLSCVLIVCLRDYRVLRRFSYVSMVVGIGLLLSPMIPGLGREIGGARIWIGIGSHSLQPGEFAKLFLAFFFASYLFDHRDQLAVGGSKFLGVRLPRIRDLGPIIVVWVASMGVLVLQHDLGTSLMFFAMFVSMLYVATGRRSWIFLGAVFFIIGAFLATLVFSHVDARIDAWLHPFSDAEYNKAYGGSGQLVRGVFGLATGGLLGTGLGQGHPWFTPLANSDFIYSSVGEELGLVGLLTVLMLYLIIIASGMITAMKVKDGFGKLLASGLVFTMAFQVFTVVGGITLVIPLTGLTMPFMAAGGSSLVANSILASLLIVISNQANKPEPEVSSDTFQYESLAALRDHEIRTRQEAKDAESGASTNTSQFPQTTEQPRTVKGEAR
ncbi:FtsW/RodA/SpoVE family cell cycle protein [Bifidobacterium psychraerophilum]|uniref:FtsW/RodA/SpoVE family cell cycle protein n=1 Tax=Bifidobacterium psychraerophilum TaxID=218140 RepID=UPI0023EF9748|nr:FtsW/RodA/SpoVE family cell cycle protein [Bifidobacterium psychraerophilum]MCI1661013.1 FtsW/RodA/SpoVE family cell cycle protein [Bifidobacterium psychraerophilum]MCI1804527.1 FtsW/RodA/SpoVE family cell cycle protein [Bifidobacterium psychraerophilum]MCI2176317.1 FtsW/RodA/SpoVE family cell cycle protein [Bifidobacterium psychraerophilum]MCI2181209.1 FtsW/RodA/SpoVE family cell cycle protein [Bifidobacterium psychraerophilum]